MALRSDQIALLIELVHGEEILWNIWAKQYRHTEKKKLSWENIGRKLSIGGDEAYKIFRSLREKYRREKDKDEKNTRSGSASYMGSSWPHMECLRFLDESHKKRRVYSSREWKENSVDQEINEFLNIDVISEHFEPDTLSEGFPYVSPMSPSGSASQIQSSSQAQSASERPYFQVQNIATVLPPFENSLNSPSSSYTSAASSAPPTTHPATQIRCNSPKENSGSQQENVRPDTVRSSRGPTPRKDYLRKASLENALSENTSHLVNALKSVVPPQNQPAAAPKPYSGFAEYIRQCMEDTSPEYVQKMETDILKIIIKYKNDNQ